MVATNSLYLVTMRHYLVFLCIALVTPFVHPSTNPSGSVELDELSFNKIIKKFEASLVKFDVSYPYGDKHEAYVALAKDARDVDDLLIAEVGVKDYGEKDNEALAKKYGATKDNFPVVKLFLKGKKEPVTFDDSKEFTTDALRRFVREHSNIYLSLPGCLKKFDELANKFMKADKDERNNLLKEAEKAVNGLQEKDKPSGKIYSTIMAKVVEKGDSFIPSENERVKKLHSGKVSDEKKKQLEIKLNILQSFRTPNKDEEAKEEL